MVMEGFYREPNEIGSRKERAGFFAAGLKVQGKT
jgi:hypothetical protein